MYGEAVLLWYRYVDKYHIEPVDWLDLFEFMGHEQVLSGIKKILADEAQKSRK